MKILVLPSWYPPRGGEFFREHSQALAAEGLDVAVLACIQTSIRKHGLTPFLFGTDFPQKTTDTNISPGTFHEIRSLYRTIPFLQKANIMGWISHLTRLTKRWISENGMPDLIQVHSSIWAGVAAAQIKKLTGVPYVITEHRSRFVYNTTEARQMFLPWHNPLLKEAFSGAAQIITVSDALQNKIISIMDNDDPTHDRIKIHPSGKQDTGRNNHSFRTKIPITIPNMVDTRFFNPAPHVPVKKPFVFFSLAHLEPVKGTETLIDAMHILTRKHAGKFHLMIGGNGSQRSLLEIQTKNLNLHDSVTFMGALTREEVRKQLHASHAFVLPSRFEAFGVVFIEAMACGLPVIAAKSGGPESFIEKACGTIVNPDNPDQLAAAMEEMAERYDEYNRDHIWQYTINKFSPKAIAAKYIRVYKELV